MRLNFVEPEDEMRETEAQVLGYNVERRDPHGFWWIVDKNKELSNQAFTSLVEVEKGILRYQSRIAERDAKVKKARAALEKAKAEDK